MKNETIGARIARLRESMGMTQTDLAKKLKTTQSAVARIEAGGQNVSTDMLRKISSVLHCNLLGSSPGSVNLSIEGGVPLSGTIETNTSKNGAVGLLCASLLNRNQTILRRVPRIEEVNRLLEVLVSIGVRYEWIKNDIKITPPTKFDLSKLDNEAARRTRIMILLIGSITHFLDAFSLPQSGGCHLGSRAVRPHFYALENFGINIKTTEDAYFVTKKRKHVAEVILYESGDTVTENAILAAALTPRKTVIKYASANYMVQELCIFLQNCGVTIEGVGTTTLEVTGLKEINKPIDYTLDEDPTDSMFFITAGIVTGSTLTVTRCPIDFLELELLKLKKMGLSFALGAEYKSHNGRTRLVDITIKPSRLKALEEKIYGRPYPGLNIDNVPFFAVIATQAEGQTLIHDWVYEKRAIYFTELDRLGADTMLADPHRIFITGPTKLIPSEMVCPPALRPASVLLIAMLAAKGKSVLRNIYSINRGYEKMVIRLRKIVAKIDYLDEF